MSASFALLPCLFLIVLRTGVKCQGRWEKSQIAGFLSSHGIDSVLLQEKGQGGWVKSIILEIFMEARKVRVHILEDYTGCYF